MSATEFFAIVGTVIVVLGLAIYGLRRPRKQVKEENKKDDVSSVI